MPFAAQYHHHHQQQQHHASRHVLSNHQFDDSQYVNDIGHVTWTSPRYDVITPQYVYNQQPTSCSTRGRGQSDPTGVTVAQRSSVAGPLQPTTDWTSPLSGAVATSTFWGCTTHNLPYDRFFTYTAMPHSSSAVQFGADCSSSTESMVDGLRFDCADRSQFASSSALTPINGELGVLATLTHSTINNERPHHQTHSSTLSHNVSSCSVNTRITGDDRKRGTRPTRASTSIGPYLCRRYAHIFQALFYPTFLLLPCTRFF